MVEYESTPCVNLTRSFFLNYTTTKGINLLTPNRNYALMNVGTIESEVFAITQSFD